MNEENDANAKTLLIGCGGSGITTLTRLNELMSSNADFRENMAECISYFVLDTDIQDLQNFEKMVALQMGFSAPPVIRSLHLTEGFRRLNEIVEPSFDRVVEDQDLTNLMKKYWWYSADNYPFRAEDITDLASGAGQCCQISYLTAWNAMPQIGEIIDSLLQALSSRDKSHANPLANLRVYIVAGIAGGTGRGSWNLVAFKIRQCLLRRGLNVPIDSIFFDATCYPNVQKDADQKKSLFVNSCTAISELVAWIQLKKRRATQKAMAPFSSTGTFFIPSLANPRTDNSTDVINFDDFKSNDSSLLAPVQSAYVIFGTNGSTAHLLNNEQYHNMAASALYAMVVNANQVGSAKSNMRSNIGSFAATSFEVDSSHIQLYLETAVQKEFLKTQCAEANEAQIQEVKTNVGTSAKTPPEGSFLEKSHLWIPSDLKFTDSYSILNTKTSLLQALFESLSKATSDWVVGDKELDDGTKVKELGLTSRLRSALAEQDADTVKSTVTTTLSLAEIDDKTINQHLSSILAAGKLDAENLEKTFRDLVMAQFAPEGEADISLRRAMLYTDELKKAFAQYLQALGNDKAVTVGPDSYKTIDKVIKAFNEDVVAKSGKTIKETLTFGKAFNAEEISELCSKFQYFAHAALFFRMKKSLNGFYTKAIEALEKIQKSLDMMSELLVEASKKLDGNLTPIFKDVSFEDIFDRLFTDSDDSEAIQRSIPSATDLKNLYYRNLKPILSRAKLHDLLTSKENYGATRKPIMNCIKEELQNLLDLAYRARGRKYDTEDDAAELVPGKISKVIMQNVYLQTDSSQRSFVDRYFSFETVLKDNIKAWNNLLAETGQSHLGNLTDQFREYLGIVYPSDYVQGKNGFRNKINLKTVVQCMIRSLVMTCNPWIELRTNAIERDKKQPLSCLVILPLDLNTNEIDENELKAEIEALYKAQKYNLSLTILHPGSDKAVKIPRDRILVFNSELLGFESIDGAPVEKILNLDYWKDYPELLEQAEDLEHNSAALFVKDGDTWVEKPRSFAFLAPFFTMEPFKSMRWHPWIKEDINLAKEQLEEVYKVLFYAFLGQSEVEGKLASALEAVRNYGCEMPLLKMGKGTHPELFWFLRDPLEWKGGKMDSALDTDWHKEDELENSINRVVEFLNGQGRFAYRNEGGTRLQKSEEEGNRIRRGLLNEAEAFFGNIPGHIGVGTYKEIVHECCIWIRTRKESSKDPEDTKYWSELFEFAKAELAKLG